jgi:hypothetical protein
VALCEYETGSRGAVGFAAEVGVEVLCEVGEGLPRHVACVHEHSAVFEGLGGGVAEDAVGSGCGVVGLGVFGGMGRWGGHVDCSGCLGPMDGMDNLDGMDFLSWRRFRFVGGWVT